jgi:hypothetical protein
MAKKKYKASVLHRINPDKSNRMIIAVVAGFGVLLLIWLLAMLLSDKKGAPQAEAEKVLSYLEKTEGIITRLIDMNANRVDLSYDYTKKGDFVLITRYAALKLSNTISDRPIDFTLTAETLKREVYRCRVEDGEMLSEWLGELPVPPPPLPVEEEPSEE